MGKGKTFKNKPTGQRQFSTREEILAGTTTRPASFSKREPQHQEKPEQDHESIEDLSSDEEESDVQVVEKRNGVQGLIEIHNPNLIRPKTLKARDVDMGNTTELSRREREELEKQRSRERYMKMQEQGKTEEAKNDLERLAFMRQQREEAAKRRKEEKEAKEKKKAESRR